jgi:hypothetical protein
MPNPSASCKQSECKRPADGGKGYCRRHYAAWKRGELAKPSYKTCRAEGCRKRVVARGRCDEHFARDYPGKRSAQSAEAPAESST